MNHKTDAVPWIVPADRRRLSAAGIDRVDQLLDRCREAVGCRTVARETGIATESLRRWTQLAELMRLAGLGPEEAELLDAVGVDCIAELRYRNAVQLSRRIDRLRIVRDRRRRVPSVPTLESWIFQAKQIDGENKR